MAELTIGSQDWIGDRRKRAVSWCQTLFDSSYDVVITDTETTGLLASKDSEIVEISIVDLMGNVKFDSLIRPQNPIPHDATKVHGIRNTHVENSPTYADVYDEITSIFNDASMVLVYNVEFDREMFIRGAKSYGLQEFRERCPGVFGRPPSHDRNWYCAMKIYSTWVGDWSNYRNDFKFQPLKGNHRAKGDCLAVIDRLKQVAQDTQMDLF